ncbi:uncharacterized protein [Apostichopus japonicus]|uniref:uncharacterized protein n=1 Tax=Stichopus japonicus TaxID=307972 RepID=UPI003AB6200B
MKPFSVAAILAIMAISANAEDNFGLVGVDFAQRLPVDEAPTDQKPDNGVCFQESMLVCEIPGAKVDYNGAEECIECFCDDQHGVVCCRSEPQPKVHNPEKCSLFLDPDSCVYTRHPKCSKACAVEAWYYSDVSGYHSDV